MCWFHVCAQCNRDARRFPFITLSFQLDGLEIPQRCEIFLAVSRRRSEIRRMSHGVGIAHYAVGWCVMNIRLALVGLLLLVLAAGCAPMPAVTVDATPADLEILAGEWSGEYKSAALDRHGSIEFKLKAGTNEAHGDVLMIPRGGRTPYQSRPSHHEDVVATGMPSSQLLTIKFIRASNGYVTGLLDRYWDPDRSCFASTTFRGYVGLGIVEGTFNTTFECGAGQATGTWTASKKAAKPNAAWR
jgi:hypothetical protein